jgi:tRNA (cytidine/uridine-2'-O-)-methyltransferase
MALNVVLVEPEIPMNTGNIGRLCLATGSTLHLVKPFGFELSDKRLKRAGLDYWQHISVVIYSSYQEFLTSNMDGKMVFFSSHATNQHWDIPFEDGMFLIFGKESVGLNNDIKTVNSDKTYKIPIYTDHVRSLNLANAVAVVVYECIRQLG